VGTAPSARDVMNRDVLGVRVDMTVREAAGFLTENHIGGAPVLDEEGRLVGVVSLTDLAENASEHPDIAAAGARARRDVRGLDERPAGGNLARLHDEPEDLLVRDIMTPTVYTVPEDTPVPEIARAMIAGRIHRLFVTRQRRVVGIVTPLDLLRLLADDAPGRSKAPSRVPVASRPAPRGRRRVTAGPKAAPSRRRAAGSRR
jgi:CBS domain-containing protein